MVTAAHNACIRELLHEVDMHGKADRHMKLLTVETESRLGTLWDQEQCTQLCLKDELWEATEEEEMKIPRKKANEGSLQSRLNLQPCGCPRWVVDGRATEDVVQDQGPAGIAFVVLPQPVSESV